MNFLNWERASLWPCDRAPTAFQLARACISKTFFLSDVHRKLALSVSFCVRKADFSALVGSNYKFAKNQLSARKTTIINYFLTYTKHFFFQIKIWGVNFTSIKIIRDFNKRYDTKLFITRKATNLLFYFQCKYGSNGYKLKIEREARVLGSPVFLTL